MLTNHQMDKVSLYCHAMVGHMFADMSNPKKRGEKFTWDGFPEMMASLCEAQIFMHFPHTTKNMKAIQKHAEKTGREIASNMVKWMSE